MKFFIILVFLLINTISVTKTLPIKNRVKHASQRNFIIPTYDQFKFMQRFGYLGDVQVGYEAQYSETAIEKAIINIQKFGAIEQTGILDEKTIELMKKRRCGVKDVIDNSIRRKRYSVMASGWKKREITYFISSWNHKLGEAGVAREIKRALDTWAGYGNLTFIRTNNPSADIIVAFGVGNHGDPFPFDGPGNILAHAFFPYVSYGGDVHFDNEENWTTNMDDDEDTTEFFAVAIHELGHSLGLGHSAVPTSIMFPYYRKYDSTIQLDYDDVMAMYQLYIRSPIQSDEKLPTTTTKKYESKEYATTEESLSTTTETFVKTTEYQSDKNSTETTKKYAITYEGDYETVDDHIKHDNKHISNDETEQSDICRGEYNAIAVLRQELFVFKDDKIWRFKTRGVVENGYPIKIYEQFPNFPPSIKKIDAAYEKMDGAIAIFSGPNYWIYDENQMKGPFSLTSYELPEYSNGIDAAFIWNKNKMTYLFKGNQFWRYNETVKKLDENYPKTMTRWRGIPNGIDAAITWTDGSTYFFKGPLYWRFDNELIKADKHYPLLTPQYWFGCPEKNEDFLQLPKEILTIGYVQY